MTRAVLLASVCVLTGAGVAACRGTDAVAGGIETAVAPAKPPAHLKEPRWKLMRQVYKDREYRPIWVGGRGPNAQARDLIATLCRAEREGLRSADYDLAGLRQALERLRATKSPDPTDLAALDLRLTALFLAYGADLLAGRLDPSAVDNGWYIKARRAGVDSTLRAALRADNFDDAVAVLRPRQREYADLVKALGEYRGILARGGWARVPAGGPLRYGDRGPRVAALRARLRASGDLEAPPDAEPVYDTQVTAAVARFQTRHGLPADGTAVGPATLAALNVPVETRVRQIELNLERYRWLPSEFGPRYVLVNIPDYQLYAYDGGRQVLQMRVIVGDEYGNATPVFADSMTHVVFRPQWDVPRSILVDEVIPKMRENIYYLAEHNYEVVEAGGGGRVLDPAAIDWSDVDTTDLRFRVRQKAGADNALGRVKFMFPNQFNIYLHDTPTPELFARANRTLSHGCVRVEHPAELAEYVLAGQDGWDDAKIREAMAGDDSTSSVTVDLKRPVPVYLVYLTAFVRDGVLQFRDDPYGKDGRALARLGRPRPGDGTLCEALEKLAGG